jgi:peptidoglycan/xylan/chitin deacetylase (PgdA/CDA1 family)
VAAGRAFLCVTIDCECDKGPAWRTRKPLTFDGVHEGIAERLHPLFRRFGAKPTYLLSPELLRDARCVERFASLEGCELGTHLHGELAEPDAFEPDVTNAVQRDYPESVERAKISWLTGAFRAAFGRPPSSFRAGRFGLGPNTVSILQDLGYSVESSVTPHLDWSHVSPGLSFIGSPTQPYHPDVKDPARPGSAALLEVPVTIRPRALSRLPVVGKYVEPRWLRPTKTSGHALVTLARETIDDGRRTRPERPIVLNAMFHNVEVVAGTSPYAATDEAARRIVDRLAALLDHARRESIACVGLSDLAELFACRT